MGWVLREEAELHGLDVTEHAQLNGNGCIRAASSGGRNNYVFEGVALEVACSRALWFVPVPARMRGMCIGRTGTGASPPTQKGAVDYGSEWAGSLRSEGVPVVYVAVSVHRLGPLCSARRQSGLACVSCHESRAWNRESGPESPEPSSDARVTPDACLSMGVCRVR